MSVNPKLPSTAFAFYELTGTQFIDRLNMRVIEREGGIVRLRFDDDSSGQLQTTELVCDSSRSHRVNECSAWTGEQRSVQTRYFYSDASNPSDDLLNQMVTEYWYHRTGKLAFTNELAVSEAGFPAGKFDRATFQIEPEPGSWVQDLQTNQVYMQSPMNPNWYQSYTVWACCFVLLLAFVGLRRSKLA